MKFSLSKEIDRLLNCVKNKDESDKEKMKTKIDEYRNSCLQEIQSLSSSSDGGTPKNDEKKKVDVKGDFDIIIPNIEKGKFEKMLENNFQKNGNTKFVVGTENKIPERFNLFAEVGLNVFHNEYKKKKGQIKKYNSILNFCKIIQDPEIYQKYKKEFEHEYYYENSIKVDIFPDEYVYLIVSNSTYAEFTSRFLDFKNYKNDTPKIKMGELNDILPKDSNSNIYCAYINFDNGINMNLIKKFEAEKKIKELEFQNEKMRKNIQKMEIKINDMKNEKNQEIEKVIEKMKNENNQEIEKMKNENNLEIEKVIKKMKNENNQELEKMKNENNQELEKMKNENNYLKNQIQNMLEKYNELSQKLKFIEISQKYSEDKNAIKG